MVNNGGIQWLIKNGIHAAFTLCIVSIVYGCSSNNDPTSLTSKNNIKAYHSYLDTATIALGNRQFSYAIEHLRNARRIVAASAAIQGSERELYGDLLCALAFEMHQYDAAIDIAMINAATNRESIVRDASFTQRLMMAHSLKCIGDREMAILWYKQALLKSSQHSFRDTYNNIAELYLQRGEYGAALTYLDSAQQHVTPGSEADVNGRAWYLFMQARCYAGMGSKKAIAKLDSGTSLLEKSRTSRNGSEYDVRMSTVRSILLFPQFKSSNNPTVRRCLTSLRAIYHADSTELEHIESRPAPTVASSELVGTTLRTLVLPPTTNNSTMLPLDGTLITGEAVDSKGWRWVATLGGLYLSVGRSLVCVDTVYPSERCKAAKLVSVKNDTLFLERYSGRIDVIPRSALVNANPQAKKTLRRKPSVEFIRWKGERPTTIIGSITSDSLLWCFGNNVGVGAYCHPPLVLQPIRTATGERWNATITCGVTINDTLAIVGTESGLFPLLLRTFVVDTSERIPTTLEHANIVSVTSFENRVLVVGLSFGTSYTVAINKEGKIQWSTLTSVDTYAQYPWQKASNNIPLFLYGAEVFNAGNHVFPVRTAHQTLGLSQRSYPRAPSVSAHSTLLKFDGGTLQVADLRQQRTDLYAVPHNDLADTMQRGICFSSASVSGAVLHNGLLVIHPGQLEEATNTSIYAVLLQGSSHYKVWADGCRMALPADRRNASIVVGRPVPYYRAQVPLQMYLPWFEQTTTATTGSVITLQPSHGGEFTVQVFSSDRAAPEFITIVANRMISEQWWFWVVVGGVIAIAVVATTRYYVIKKRQRALVIEQQLMKERVQIGYDLHDALGADLVRINMLAKQGSTGTAADEIVQVTTEAGRTLRDIIWSVSESRTIDEVIAIIAERVRDRCTEAGITPHIAMPPSIPTVVLAPQVLRDISLVVTEAVTNVIKHANATELNVVVTVNSNSIYIAIADNGVGFDIEQKMNSSRHGLRSYQARAMRSNLHVDVTSNINNGTTVTLTITLPS